MNVTFEKCGNRYFVTTPRGQHPAGWDSPTRKFLGVYVDAEGVVTGAHYAHEGEYWDVGDPDAEFYLCVLHLGMDAGLKGTPVENQF